MTVHGLPLSADTAWKHLVRLLPALVGRELRARYRGTVVGILWLVFQPAVLLATYTVVFGYVFKAPASVGPNGTDVPYVAYIALALWPWLAFSEAISRGLVAIQAHAAIVKKIAFPSAALVLAAVAASFFVHTLGMMVVLVALSMWGVPLSLAGWGWHAAGMLCLAVPALGLALCLASVQVFVRDVELLTNQLLTLAFYATPVIYTSAMVPPWLLPVLQLNPVGHIIELMRHAMLAPGSLPAVIDGSALGLALLVFALTLGAGVWIFQRLAPHFEDAL